MTKVETEAKLLYALMGRLLHGRTFTNRFSLSLSHTHTYLKSQYMAKLQLFQNLHVFSANVGLSSFQYTDGGTSFPKLLTPKHSQRKLLLKIKETKTVFTGKGTKFSQNE